LSGGGERDEEGKGVNRKRGQVVRGEMRVGGGERGEMRVGRGGAEG
jgi:hypothetical protein